MTNENKILKNLIIKSTTDIRSPGGIKETTPSEFEKGINLQKY